MGASGDAPRGGVPVGALSVAAEHANALRKALWQAGFLKAGTNVTPHAPWGGENGAGPPRLAVHLSQAGAAAMEQVGARALPDAAAAFVEAGEARWCPGLRVLSSACRGGGAPAARGPETGAGVFTYSELFAGVGGFRIGLDALGGRSVFASELDAEARLMYKANFGDQPHGDITEVEATDIEPHDLLTAGFPCQPFSKLGEVPGFEDPRGLLFLEIVRVLTACRPKAFLLENVANLVWIDGGSAFREILQELADAGYDVQWRLLNSSVVLPQHRIRVYLVGLRQDLPERGEFRWPELPVLDTTVEEVLEGEHADSDPGYLLTDHQLAKLSADPEYLRDPGSRLVRLAGRARTLTSHYRTGHRNEFVLRAGAARPRFLTVRECARLQGFPEDVAVLRGDGQTNANRAYHQLGNAVCPVVVAAIVACILKALGRDPQTEGSFAAGPDPHRNLSAAALGLLLAASPAPDAPGRGGRAPLRRLCASFLRCEPGCPRPCTGCGDGLSPADLGMLRGLLESGQACAEASGLFMLGRVVYLETQGRAEARGTAARVVDAGLLPLSAAGLASSAAEVERLAVMTLLLLSQCEAAAGPLAGDEAAVGRLSLLARGEGPAAESPARHARDILRNLGLWGGIGGEDPLPEGPPLEDDLGDSGVAGCHSP